MKKRTYLEMQTEEATWNSGRYALANGASPEQATEDNPIFEAFERIMLSLGNDVGRQPLNMAHFTLSEESREH